MKFLLAAGLALAGLTTTALADPPRIDADNDGWVTRAEAAAMAENMFNEMDRNHDGKLDASDRPDDGPPGDQVFHRRFERHEEGGHDHGDADAPHPPHPPAIMMLMFSREEADTNGDGALSLQEFRAQHLRFFDASDVNGDGRFHFEHPPEPPRPPEAPQPPR